MRPLFFSAAVALVAAPFLHGAPDVAVGIVAASWAVALVGAALEKLRQQLVDDAPNQDGS